MRNPAEQALRRVAELIAEQMRDTRTDLSTSSAARRSQYAGQNWSLGCVLRVWRELGIRGEPLDEMPPEDIADTQQPIFDAANGGDA